MPKNIWNICWPVRTFWMLLKRGTFTVSSFPYVFSSTFTSPWIKLSRFAYEEDVQIIFRFVRGMKKHVKLISMHWICSLHMLMPVSITQQFNNDWVWLMKRLKHCVSMCWMLEVVYRQVFYYILFSFLRMRSFILPHLFVCQLTTLLEFPHHFSFMLQVSPYFRFVLN